MEVWFLLSLLALLLLGAQRFLYKVAAERGCRSALTTAVFMGTVTLASAALFFFSDEPVPALAPLFGLSLLNSLSFALATIAHMEALRHLPAGITFPLTRLSLVVVILFSIFYFGEELGALQWCGVVLAFLVVLLLRSEARSSVRREGSLKAGLFFVLACVLCGALASISSKLAADSLSKSAFIAVSYAMGTGFSLLIEYRRGGAREGGATRAALGIGLLMGILNLVGFYAFLSALQRGPLSVIALITGMHFVIAILLAMLFYGETLSFRRGCGLALTVLAVLLMRP